MSLIIFGKYIIVFYTEKVDIELEVNMYKEQSVAFSWQVKMEQLSCHRCYYLEIFKIRMVDKFVVMMNFCPHKKF